MPSAVTTRPRSQSGIVVAILDPARVEVRCSGHLHGGMLNSAHAALAHFLDDADLRVDALIDCWDLSGTDPSVSVGAVRLARSVSFRVRRVLLCARIPPTPEFAHDLAAALPSVRVELYTDRKQARAAFRAPARPTHISP